MGRKKPRANWLISAWLAAVAAVWSSWLLLGLLWVVDEGIFETGIGRLPLPPPAGDFAVQPNGAITFSV